jgi:hypothetical protein
MVIYISILFFSGQRRQAYGKEKKNNDDIFEGGEEGPVSPG